jgi:hypothetical protein
VTLRSRLLVVSATMFVALALGESTCLAMFTYGEGGIAQDGRNPAHNLVESGNAATVYVYSDHTVYNNSGKVNSIYVRPTSGYEDFEAGWMTNNDGCWGYGGTGAGLTVAFSFFVDAQNNPFMRTLTSPGNYDASWEQTAIRENYDSQHPRRWSVWIMGRSYTNLDVNFDMLSGNLVWGSERMNGLTPRGGSFRSCQYYDGVTWSYIYHGTTYMDADPAVRFNGSQLPTQNWATFVTSN